jgi:hypothetical protein
MDIKYFLDLQDKYLKENMHLKSEAQSVVINSLFDNTYNKDITFTEFIDSYIYETEICKQAFEILKAHGYDMKWEIIHAIKTLGSLEDFNENSKAIKKLITSPVIKDILFDGKKFTIASTYGKIPFVPTKIYFKDNEKVTKYIEKETLNKRCHAHAYRFSLFFPDYTSITSLCSYDFIGKCYHSYTFNEEEKMIIDLCNNCVIPKYIYDLIIGAEEISIIKNSDVPNELRITNKKSGINIKDYNLLKIALYKEYLESINYNGSLTKAPYAKF